MAVPPLFLIVAEGNRTKMDICPLSQNFAAVFYERTIKEINPKRFRGTGKIVRRC
jgi:hypothetical protein